jgi:hypothetical protein
MTSEALRNSNLVILSNLSLFLLCLSTTIYVYSLYDADEDIIRLNNPSFFQSRRGAVLVGKSMKKKTKKYKFFLPMKDLEKHMFICGATGTGKSNFLQYFLLNFKKRFKIPFLLVEFKGEYHFLQKKIRDLLIIRPGENFSINIFNPEGNLPEIHAERIFDILKSGNFLDENAEFSPQMEKVLVEILTKVCETPQFQSWEGFYKYCKGYLQNHKREIPMLSQTLISIQNRIRRFSLGSLKAIFDTEHQIKVANLFDKNILIDLSSIIRLGGEKDDALFFLNMVLKYLWDRNISRGAFNYKGINHITIVEDAQYFVPQDLMKKSKLTTYLEDIALLQRGTGECLISLATHPDISEEILANCGVLIVFKSHMDKEILCKLLNLDEEHQDYLAILEEGQCIIRVNTLKRPFVLSIPYIERESLEISEINKYNQLALSRSENFSPEIPQGLMDFFINLKNKLKKYFLDLNMKFKRFKKRIKKDHQELELQTLHKTKVGKFDKRQINKIEEPEEEIESTDFNELEEFVNKLYNQQEEKS